MGRTPAGLDGPLGKETPSGRGAAAAMDRPAASWPVGASGGCGGGGCGGVGSRRRRHAVGDAAHVRAAVHDAVTKPEWSWAGRFAFAWALDGDKGYVGTTSNDLSEPVIPPIHSVPRSLLDKSFLDSLPLLPKLDLLGMHLGYLHCSSSPS